jgi:hypothetical protein
MSAHDKHLSDPNAIQVRQLELHLLHYLKSWLGKLPFPQSVSMTHVVSFKNHPNLQAPHSVSSGPVQAEHFS